ncbi:uncharacterized protein FRV6_04412 [Fusarium oxysporum]|uniref:Uncharacterized protein n=1 Tax=Fusarium oxysporum TaxID=5507 RepID=A0A2H3SY88_FUSOX|nr:uncharacterized protein FRV6_04412 [Fusarium oxysporum]
MSLDSRRASCHSDMRVRQLIKRFDSPKIDPKGGLGALTKTFSTAISKTWTCTKDYERRVRQPVREGLDRKVVIIDNEFDPITHELYETAIIDRVSGETLLNTLIAHTEETKSAVPSRRTQGEKGRNNQSSVEEKGVWPKPRIGTAGRAPSRKEAARIRHHTKDNISGLACVMRRPSDSQRLFGQGGIPQHLAQGQKLLPTDPSLPRKRA